MMLNISFSGKHVIGSNIGDNSRRCVVLLRREIILVAGYRRARVDFDVGRKRNGIGDDRTISDQRIDETMMNHLVDTYSYWRWLDEWIADWHHSKKYKERTEHQQG